MTVGQFKIRLQEMLSASGLSREMNEPGLVQWRIVAIWNRDEPSQPKLPYTSQCPADKADGCRRLLCSTDCIWLLWVLNFTHHIYSNDLE